MNANWFVCRDGKLKLEFQMFLKYEERFSQFNAFIKLIDRTKNVRI